VQAVVGQVSQVTVRTQSEPQAVQVDSAEAGAVLGHLVALAEQGYSTFSTRRHYEHINL
jgi:hypothetical protein